MSAPPTIDPGDLASRVQQHLEDKARALAFELGYSLMGDGAFSNIKLGVHQIAIYAETGTPPEGRPELVGEYILTVATALGHLDPQSGLYAELEQTLKKAQARDAITTGHPVPHDWLATLAGMSRKHLWSLSKRRDAPDAKVDPDERRRRVYDPEACRGWLAGRGVAGMS